MEILADLHSLHFLLILYVNMLQVLISHTLQSILRPSLQFKRIEITEKKKKAYEDLHAEVSRTCLEPVNRAAVDERWELPQSVPECITNWTEGNDNVHVLTAAIHKECKQSQWTEVSILVSS